MIQRKSLLPSPLGKYFFLATKVLVAGGTLYFVLTMVHLDQLVTLFKMANYWYIIAGAALLPLNLGIRIIKWKMLVSSFNNTLSWKNATRSILIGIAFGSFTPGEFGDFFGRMFHLQETRKSHVVGLVLVDRIQTMLAMALLGLPTLFFLVFSSTVLQWILTVGTVVTILALNALFGKQFLFLVEPFQHIRYVGNITTAMFQLQRRQQFLTFLLSVSLLVVIEFQMFLLLNAFYSVQLLQGMSGTGLVLFAKSFLPVSIGDLGIRELITAYVFSQWNIPLSISVNASLLLFALNVFVPALLGTIIFLCRKEQ